MISSAWLEDYTVWLQASGPPPYRLRAEDPAIETGCDLLIQAANWVFLSGADIEARHIIFANELARANREDQTFVDTITRALDAAKATYEAHVQSSSRETLKALGDLRKAVVDETQKVAQKTQDLTAALWRDLAVTAAPFVLKLLGDVNKITAYSIAAGFYFGAAFFIALSFSLQWWINRAYFKSQTKSRSVWLRTLYNYVSTREREEIADIPIRDAMRNYNETQAILFVIYLILVVLLVGFGASTLWQNSSPVSPASVTPSSPASKPVSLRDKTLYVPSAKVRCPKSNL